MDVLAEILSWSKDRPLWQRDALRRLVTTGDPDETDIEALTEICKSAYGLADEQEAVPLANSHLPATGASVGRVDLHSISHIRGVNALADDQTLNFNSGLTVVYGDNAAGKSGYTRISHDVVFLLSLRQYADKQGVETLDQHVRQLKIGAGVCDAELPWVAMPVKRRISFLRKSVQKAEKLFKDGHQSVYEKEAAYIYGRLREAWERGLEEVLLGGIVERYRISIQTQQIDKIADITSDDCKSVDVGMTKCSAWLPGHDQAPAAKQDTPEPDEIKADIEALDNWVKGIRYRRAKSSAAEVG